MWLFWVVFSVCMCYSRAKVEKHLCFVSRISDKKLYGIYFFYSVAALQVKLPICFQIRPLMAGRNVRKETYVCSYFWEIE